MSVTNFSPLLGLALPTTGDLSGTWGTVVNTSITNLIDSAIAGTTTLSADSNVTLSATNGSANQAREAILLCTGARTSVKTITAPAQSKTYVVINATSGGYDVKLVGSGPTAGILIPPGTRALVVWNGSDFVKIVSNPVILTTDVSGVLPIANGGTGTSSTTFTNLTTNVAGTLPPANGGTGITDPGAAGNILTSDGSGAWTSSTNTSVTAGKSITFAIVFGF
jgi:hypothetical protein